MDKVLYNGSMDHLYNVSILIIGMVYAIPAHTLGSQYGA